MHKLSIAGFRHSHIFDLKTRAEASAAVELVATCEEHLSDSLWPAGEAKPTHDSFQELLDNVDCTIIGLGDTYGRRGAQAIAALRAGKHVISDKPLCTSLKELDEIESLVREKGLQVGVMLDMRDSGQLKTLRSLVREGRIGEIQTIHAEGQHPLMLGKRPSWYFEPGQHGGTINDIAIHAVDMIPWVTGLEVSAVSFARCWNAKASDFPHFEDCGQFALQLSNEAGVLGDVSYLAPDGCGFTIPNYWRFTLHGTKGILEVCKNVEGVRFADDTSSGLETIPVGAGRAGGYLEDFLAGIEGRTVHEDQLSTADCLKATRTALEIQAAADQA